MQVSIIFCSILFCFVGNALKLNGDSPNRRSNPLFGINKSFISFKKVASASIVALTLPLTVSLPQNSALANEPPAHSLLMSLDSKLTLDQAVQALEAGETRDEVLQGMADVYQSTASKSLLAKAKYKQRIITTINEKHRSLNNKWDPALSFASSELKRGIDPYRTVDLSSYLKVAPIIAGVCYLGTLFIQQAIPELFIIAYPAAVFVFVAPILYTLFTT